MESVSNVSICKTSVKPQQKTVINTTKDKTKNTDNSKKIIVGLTALGAAALAGIMIAKGKSKNTVKTMEEIAGKRAQNAAKEIANGGNYRKIKKEATKNLTHNGKKIVKGEIKKVRAARVAVENAEKEISKKNNEAIQTASNTITNLSQGIKKQDNKTIQNQINEAANLANKATEAATEQAKYATKNPTHKNIKKTKYMQNQAIKAENEANALKEKGQRIIAENNKKEAEKIINIEKMKSSPNYETGSEKQRINAEKGIKNKAKREANKLKNHPAYQRFQNSLKWKSESALKTIAETSTNKFERAAAQDLLAK